MLPTQGPSVPPDVACFGGRPLFESVLDSNARFLATGGPKPKFVYSHLVVAHQTPANAGYYDAELRAHLERVQQESPDTAIVVMGDHGFVNIACDQRWPLVSLLLPAYRAAWAARARANADRTLSGWDLYATLRHLASGDDEEGDWFGLSEVGPELHVAPLKSGQKVHRVNPDRGFSWSSELMHPVSMLQPVPSRTCAQVGIMEEHCEAKVVRALDCAADDCEAWSARAAACVAQVDVQRANQLAGRDGCAAFELDHLQTVTEFDSNFYELVFQVRQGDPPRVFRARAASDECDLIELAQLTRYSIYEHCTPSGVDPLLCVC